MTMLARLRFSESPAIGPTIFRALPTSDRKTNRPTMPKATTTRNGRSGKNVREVSVLTDVIAILKRTRVLKILFKTTVGDVAKPRIVRGWDNYGGNVKHFRKQR